MISMVATLSIGPDFEEESKWECVADEIPEQSWKTGKEDGMADDLKNSRLVETSDSETKENRNRHESGQLAEIKWHPTV